MTTSTKPLVEWHRIDDPEHPAPKDGTKILAYDPIAEAIIVIEWDGGWCVSWDLSSNEDCTHWQPLPEPPRP